MPRPSRSKLSPWIENLVLSYGGQEGSSSSGRLKAHVIGVGQMSQSQAQGSEGPTWLLFLSDGVLQIPAILTASAWEHLQEQEDRESFSSLVNTTVCIQDYRLQFHMAHEQTKCRFFLSVGELATTAAGPVKDNTPCCTTCPSVRLKIYKTWRALQGQEVQESQKSQCGFDLSALLGEWQHDCLQAVLDDVRERLVTSTSTYTSSTFTATSWDVDRVSYKGVKCFSVPIKCLFIPEEDAQQLQTPLNAGSRKPGGPSAASEDRRRDLPPTCKTLEATQPSVDVAEWRIAAPAVAERNCNTRENSPLAVEGSMLHEDMITGIINMDTRHLSNPWDIFPPPCGTSSSSDASPEATPVHSQYNATLSSTQIPAHSSRESQQTSDHSKGECKEETQITRSPPSWLFDTQAGYGAKEGSGRKRGPPAGTLSRKTPTVHSDGKAFSYSYQVSGQNLQDFSLFRVPESLLHWAVKYLVAPQKKDNPHSTSNQTLSDKTDVI
uniref:Shelterin complex subunit TPP1/Est3 domain-containing protein n=1 Tax=Monopterus albus TaxID=43700 RepID=A0A3Q3JBE8_MONAL